MEIIRVEEGQECQPPYTFAFGVSWHCHVRRQDEWGQRTRVTKIMDELYCIVARSGCIVGDDPEQAAEQISVLTLPIRGLVIIRQDWARLDPSHPISAPAIHLAQQCPSGSY